MIKSNLMAPLECCTARTLLALHTQALAAFHKSQEPVLNGIRPGHAKYGEVRDLIEHAYHSVLKTQRLYRQHIAKHRCRASGPKEPEWVN